MSTDFGRYTVQFMREGMSRAVAMRLAREAIEFELAEERENARVGADCYVTGANGCYAEDDE